ncbi:MAG: YggS family pyridoxal phosphate-dependent enzyme [Eubacterium sp.]|jgi:pyridoxal phosphate enzyme (YggS family)|nr:YggS family pyridoxal phosphate-dependent enzyme [Eubacterium sp.]MCI2197666.1 YggS family pyridoxal phosphate-dependent enzyme [Eubacterium sp.]
MSIKTNIEEVRRHIAAAAEKSGRKPEDITLVAVTKLHEADEMNEAIDAGATDIGENKVQEVLRKYDDVKPVRWHLIGHLQTNKVRQIIDKVCLIHSVDSFHLAKEIEKRAVQHDMICKILIQVNTAHEDSKFGVEETEVDGLIKEITENCPHIQICGLMCIAPYEADPEDCRPVFRKAKAIYDRYDAGEHNDRIDFRYLSMGMTNDYEVAIEEGSNMVRVGTAIFGRRDYRSEEK